MDNLELLYQRYNSIKNLLTSQGEHLLSAFATGDRKIENTIKKSYAKESEGYEDLQHLILGDYIQKELSREKLPQKSHPKQKLKKSLRRYRVQNKIRFKKPFFRFWYRYIYPNQELLESKEFDILTSIILDDLENYVSLFFEELSLELLKRRYSQIKSIGSYWDRKVELDILIELENGKKIVGECKWKNSKICRKTLTTLQKKCEVAQIEVESFALFSKSGFSNELLKNKDPHILLFDLEDFKELSHQKPYKKKEKTPYSYEF